MLLVVRDLVVSYRAGGRVVKAVRGVSFELDEGESICIVGESGCGKTTLGAAISRTLPPNAVVERGEVIIDGVEVLKTDPRLVRGRLVSLIPQEVGLALSPFNTIGEVFIDIMRERSSAEPGKTLSEASKLLGSLGFSDPERILRSYPHELSGGMLQRILIALAVSSNPRLIIADEPTSMVDASLRLSIVELLNRVRDLYGVSMVVITHDIAITPSLCDLTAVMYAGKIVEIGGSKEIIDSPAHPYARMLIRSIPRIRRAVSLKPIPGLPPDLSNPPRGCPFAPRCPEVIGDICHNIEPKGIVDSNRKVYCHLYGDGKP